MKLTLRASGERCGWRPGCRRTARVLSLLLCALPIGCGPERGSQSEAVSAPRTQEASPAAERLSLSPDAKLDTHEMLRADLERERHAADGGGRAWLEGVPKDGLAYRVGSRQRFEVVYQAGPLGVAEGGAVFLQISPFWGWDPSQTLYRDASGYTEVSTTAEGVALEVDGSSFQLLVVSIAGRALDEGEQIRFVYGAGEAGARIDSYAEAEARIFIAVDGDGDGMRALIAQSPSLEVFAAPASRLQLTLPSTARPGEKVRLTLAALDHVGNASTPERGEIVFVDPPAGLALPERVSLEPEHRGHRTIEFEVQAAGVYRLRAYGRGMLEGLMGESNPLVVREELPRLLWGDLHGHSQLSDGTGTPEQYFDYARNVAGLDVSALTDHDHWGMRFLDATPTLWQRIKRAVLQHHEPGRFVSLLGYEWTSWLHGHRHVLYFSDEGEVLSSMDARYETPSQLWQALEGRPALTFAHHSAGGPVATNWQFPPHPELEPVTEIVSVHGSSEAPDSPGRIYSPVPGNFVRDVLGQGYRLGFIGSGDSHDGHPGLAQLSLAGGQGGLAAIQSETLTRAGVLAAMRARHVYATSGPRIFLSVTIDGQPMGSILTNGGEAAADGQQLSIEVVATAPLDRIDLIRSGRTATLPGEGRLALSHGRVIPRLAPGEFHYVRVVQEDGGAAWSSPIFGPSLPQAASAENR